MKRSPRPNTKPTVRTRTRWIGGLILYAVVMVGLFYYAAASLGFVPHGRTVDVVDAILFSTALAGVWWLRTH